MRLGAPGSGGFESSGDTGRDHQQQQQSRVGTVDVALGRMADEEEQSLLPPFEETPGAPAASAARFPPAAATSARLLHALPQFSQWLQDVNTQAQQQMHELRRQSSSGSSSLPDPTLLEHASEHIVGVAPQSRRRGASGADALASTPAPFDLHASRSPRYSAPPSSHSNPALSLPRSMSLDVDAMSDEDSPRPATTAPLLGAEATEEPLFAPGSTALPATPRETASSNGDDQSALDELQALFRRCHHSLPFVALFIIYFAYEHTTGIVVFFIGTVAIMGLDQRIRAQVALKDHASVPHLVGVIAMCAVDTLALCCIDGDVNPLQHFAKTLERSDSAHNSVFWDVLWTVVVNDFIIRLWSLAVKAAVAVVKADTWRCLRRQQRDASAVAVAPHGDSEDGEDRSGDLESQAPAPRRAPSSVTFYRRKRKLYGIIEMVSIFVRSLLAGVPWCSYYQLCSSKFVADTFTFGYIFLKAVILGTQGRQILALVRSFITLGLEFGTYVSHADLVEAGSPDCSICYETMQQPVKLACSHMFCEECVMEWFDRERSCPLCRASMASTSPRNGSSSASRDEVKPQYLDGSTSLFPQLF